MRRMLLVIITTIGLLFGVSGVAQAAPGRIYSCAAGPGSNGVEVLLESNYSGDKSTAWVQTPGCIGEGTGRLGHTEPEGYKTRAGWCSSWRANYGVWQTGYRGGSTGIWVSTFPGEGYGGTWRVDIRHWDC